jgi:hypothetical protein
MANAHQSVSTLREIVFEATKIAGAMATPQCRELAKRLATVRRSLTGSASVSAEVEQEILSLWALARVEESRSRSGSRDADHR